MRKIILIVEASFLGVKYCIEAAIKLNFIPIVLSDLSIQEGDALKEILSVKYIECNTSDADTIIDIIEHYGRKNIAGIITHLDSRLLVVAEVCKRSGLPGVDHNILDCKDKAKIDDLMSHETPNSVAIQTTSNSDFKSVKNFISNASSNLFIAKPRFGAGGRGSFGFDNYDELLQKIFALKECSHEKVFDDRYIVQVFQEGELVSIEGYICNKDVIFFGANGRRKVKNTESSCLFPYDDFMSEGSYLECCSISRNLLNKTKIDNSFFHLEFIVCGSEIKLIDANLGRPPGGSVLEMLANSFQLQVSDLYAQVISVHVLGQEYIQGSFFKCNKIKKSLGVLYGIPEESTIYEINLKSEVASYHNVAINMGRHVSEMGKDNWSIVGTFSGDVGSVLHDLSNITIEIDSGFVKPKFALFEKELLFGDQG